MNSRQLIAKHPELLDGEQIRPGDARRWILITREKGIAASSGEGARWSVDHLIVDQDAVPTLVEVKRGSNPEIRRSIVGQMLEYAAHASETWTASELRSAFENQTGDRGFDPDGELATLLQGYEEPDVEGFWQDVATNLAARRLRLLFVADEIPDALAQVVTFLNAQMPGIEVLAVEVKRFHGGSAQTLVPRVIGRTVTGSAHGRGRIRTQAHPPVVPGGIHERRGARCGGAPVGGCRTIRRLRVLRNRRRQHSCELLDMAATRERCLALSTTRYGMDAHPRFLLRGGDI